MKLKNILAAILVLCIAVVYVYAGFKFGIIGAIKDVVEELDKELISHGGPPPDAPSNLSAIVVSYGRIDLTWTDNSSTEYGFKIHVWEADEDKEEHGEVGVNITSYSVTGLTPDTGYYFSVYAYNDTGSSADCESVYAETQSLSITEAGSYNPTESVEKTFVSGNYAYMACGYDGIVIADISNPASPSGVGSFSNSYTVYDVFVAGNYAYLANSSYGLTILDISNPASPVEVGVYLNSGYTYCVNVVDDYAYISNSSNGLEIVDISNPASPSQVGSYYYYASSDSDMFISGNYAYVADYSNGLRIFDISDKSNPEQTNTISSYYIDNQWSTYYIYAYGVYVSGNYAYVACSNNGLVIVDVSDPEAPTYKSNYSDKGSCYDVYVKGDYAYTAHDYNGFAIVDISDPTSPEEVGDYSTSDSEGVFISGDYIYVSDQSYGLRIIDSETTDPSTAPDAPSSLTVVSVTRTQVNLSWTDNSSDEDGFKVERKTTSGSYSLVGTNSANDSTYTDTGLTTGVTYYYRVYAYNSAGNSSYTSEVSTVTASSAIPDAPTSLAVASVTDSQVNLSWTDNADNETGYKIERGSSSATTAFSQISTTSANATTYSDTSVVLNTQYYYRVRAYNDTGNSAYSSVVSTTTNSLSITLIGNFVPSESFYDITISSKYAYISCWASGLMIVDISTPSSPSKISIFDTGTAYSCDVSGNYAYVGDYDGLHVLDISDPSSISEVGTNPYYYYANDIQVVGNYAYTASDTAGLAIYDVSDPTSPTYKTRYDTSGVAEGVHVVGDYAYVADGSKGLRIINVSNLSSMTEKGSYDTLGTSYKVFVKGDYAYVADSLALVIIDISNPLSPTLAGKLNTSGTAYDVTVYGNYALVADANSGFVVVDVSDPTSPSVAGTYDTAGTAYSIVKYNDYTYVADAGSSLQVFDINLPAASQAPSAPTNIQSAQVRGAELTLTWEDMSDNETGFKVERSIDGSSYSQIALTPQDTNWLLDTGLTVDTTYYYRVRAYNSDGNSSYATAASTKTDIIQIEEVGYVDISGSENAYGVYVEGNYAYLADYNYASGLRVFDISDPTNPSELGSDATNIYNSYRVVKSSQYAYVVHDTYMSIIDVSDPSSPTNVHTANLSDYMYDIDISSNYAYIAYDSYGLAVFDISIATFPIYQGALANPSVGDAATGIVVASSYAYLANSTYGMWIADISTPTSPTYVSTFDTSGNARKLCVSGNYAYIADNTSGLRIVDISNPASPSAVAYHDTPGNAYDVKVDGNYAYVADYGGGLRVVDISDPSNPLEDVNGSYDTSGNAQGVFVSGDYVYVADGSYGLRIFRVYK